MDEQGASSYNHMMPVDGLVHLTSWLLLLSVAWSLRRHTHAGLLQNQIKVDVTNFKQYTKLQAF